jgi:hypothetical protein
MKYKEPFKYLLFYIFSSILSLKSFSQSKKNDTSDSVIIKIESEVKNINQNKTLSQFSAIVPYIYYAGKKINVSIFADRGNLRKLKVVSYDESYTTAGIEEYYFDKSTQVIEHLNLMENVTRCKNHFKFNLWRSTT